MTRVREKHLQSLTISHLLRAGCTIRARAYGISMYPTIQDGDEIILQPIKSSDKLKAGNIVAIETHRNIIAIHRVIKRGSKKNRVITKGDNYQRIDGFVPSNQILGMVVEVYRDGERVNLTWKKCGIKTSLFFLLSYYFITRYIRKFPIYSKILSVLRKIWNLLIHTLKGLRNYYLQNAS